MDGDIVAESNVVRYIGGGLLREAPQKGATAVVLLVRRNVGAKTTYWIPSSSVPCFPRLGQQPFPDARPALCEVTGFDDPKVTETIENLRKLRGKQREEAEQKAAAEKKSPQEKQSAK